MNALARGIAAGDATAPSIPQPAPAGDPRWQIQRLWDAGAAPAGTAIRGGPLPAELRDRLDGRLEIPLRPGRPTLIANLVETLDGVVALDRAGATGGREISGGSAPDRFVMGLLRATADAVLVGAGTVRASRNHAWTPASAYPAAAPAYARWRGSLGLPASGPTTVVVSASGELDLRQLRSADAVVPVIVASTTAGARRLDRTVGGHGVEIVAVSDGPRVPVDAIVRFIRERGYGLVLSEGGPTLFGELLAAGVIDELFLTVAPQVAGRSDRVARLGLAEGVAFPSGLAPWARLRHVMRSDDHLFLRYDLANRDTRRPA